MYAADLLLSFKTYDDKNHYKNSQNKHNDIHFLHWSQSQPPSSFLGPDWKSVLVKGSFPQVKSGIGTIFIKKFKYGQHTCSPHSPASNDTRWLPFHVAAVSWLLAHWFGLVSQLLSPVCPLVCYLTFGVPKGVPLTLH